MSWNVKLNAILAVEDEGYASEEEEKDFDDPTGLPSPKIPPMSSSEALETRKHVEAWVNRKPEYNPIYRYCPCLFLSKILPVSEARHCSSSITIANTR